QAPGADLSVGPLAADHRPACPDHAGDGDLGLFRRPLAGGDGAPVRRSGGRRGLGGRELSRRPLGPESGADLGTRRAVDAAVDRLPARSLPARRRTARRSGTGRPHAGESPRLAAGPEIGRASCREWWSVAGAPVPVTTD